MMDRKHARDIAESMINSVYLDLEDNNFDLSGSRRNNLVIPITYAYLSGLGIGKGPFRDEVVEQAYRYLSEKRTGFRLVAK